jgi:hypothetical protein
VTNRVWLTSGERGLIGEPESLPVLREGVNELARLIAGSGIDRPPVVGIGALRARLECSWHAESSTKARDAAVNRGYSCPRSERRAT